MTDREIKEKLFELLIEDKLKYKEYYIKKQYDRLEIIYEEYNEDFNTLGKLNTVKEMNKLLFEKENIFLKIFDEIL